MEVAQLKTLGRTPSGKHRLRRVQWIVVDHDQFDLSLQVVQGLLTQRVKQCCQLRWPPEGTDANADEHAQIIPASTGFVWRAVAGKTS